jgi:hypothetical protein
MEKNECIDARAEDYSTSFAVLMWQPGPEDRQPADDQLPVSDE